MRRVVRSRTSLPHVQLCGAALTRVVHPAITHQRNAEHASYLFAPASTDRDDQIVAARSAVCKAAAILCSLPGDELARPVGMPVEQPSGGPGRSFVGRKEQRAYPTSQQACHATGSTRVFTRSFSSRRGSRVLYGTTWGALLSGMRAPDTCTRLRVSGARAHMASNSKPIAELDHSAQ
jgi:hypothetical protein